MIHTTPLLIIGSGPAGYTAAIYAARAGLSPIQILGFSRGGQLTTTTDVENYPGFKEIIEGPWLMEQMYEQAKNVGVTMIEDHIQEADLSSMTFKGLSHTIKAKALIIATGAQAKWLGHPKEEEFKGYGVSACATCDGFFYKGKDVCVIGGGNTAVEEALYLTKHAHKVTLIHRRDSLRAEKVLQDRLLSHPSIDVVWNHTLSSLEGTQEPKALTHVIVEDVNTQKKKHIPAEGLFIAIGHMPQTELFHGQLSMDSHGYITVTPGSTRTSHPGVFAAGDVQDKVYRQAITAAGQGCMAALDALHYIDS